MNSQLSPYSSLKDRRYAFTLTEIAIVLGVIGLVIGSIWFAASRAIEKNRINQAIRELQVISQGVMKLQNGRTFSAGNIGTDITSAVIAAGLIPSEALTSATTATTPWGGQLAVVADSGANFIQNGTLPAGDGTPPNEFSIQFNVNVPLDACIAMVAEATNCKAGTPGCPDNMLSSSCCWAINPPATNWRTSLGDNRSADMSVPALSAAGSMCTNNGSNGAQADLVFMYLLE